MPSLADVLKVKLEALTRRMDRSTGVYEVTVSSPLEVYLDGVETAVPAIGLPGADYTVGTKGRYFLDQGQQPYCLPTSSTP